MRVKLPCAIPSHSLAIPSNLTATSRSSPFHCVLVGAKITMNPAGYAWDVMISRVAASLIQYLVQHGPYAPGLNACSSTQRRYTAPGVVFLHQLPKVVPIVRHRGEYSCLYTPSATISAWNYWWVQCPPEQTHVVVLNVPLISQVGTITLADLMHSILTALFLYDRLVTYRGA